MDLITGLEVNQQWGGENNIRNSVKQLKLQVETIEELKDENIYCT